MAFFRIPYCDVELVDIKPNEEGEQVTNTLSAEQSFLKSFLVEQLETNAAYYMNFANFRESVDLHQLMPEKEVMDELKRLRQAHQQFLVQKQDMEATIDEFKG
jgi:hypothetical protein